MEEEINNNMLQFIDTDTTSTHLIKVIGVGGGGTNTVNHMYDQGIAGVDFIVCNTDSKSLNSSPVETKIQLGTGLGAGNNPEVAKRYAEGKVEEFRSHLERDTKMLFITAGMGGGTGTGASPVIAKIAKEINLDDEVSKILVVAIVTLPFSFEGSQRMEQALNGVKELRQYVDSILVISGDKILDGESVGFRKAFSRANDILLTAAKSIAEIITKNSYINIDFRDVNTVMQNSGTALMGAGEANGENRAISAIQQATTSSLLDDNDISGAKNILLHISCSEEYEATNEEITEISGYVTSLTSGKANLIWGIGFDESLGENIKTIIIATGFERKDEHKTPQDSIEKQPTIVVTDTKHTAVETEHIVPTTLNTKPVVDNQPKTIVLSFDGKPVSDNKETKPVTNTIPEQGNEVVIIARPKNDTDVKVEQPIQHQVVVDTLVKPTAYDAVSSQENTYTRNEEIEVRNEQLTNIVKTRQTLISSLINDPKNFAEIERQPAYLRNGVQLAETPHSSEKESLHSSVSSDGTITPNAYLYKTVD